MTRSEGGYNLPQFDALTAESDLVTLGIGGNDLDLSSRSPAARSPRSSGGSGSARHAPRSCDRLPAHRPTHLVAAPYHPFASATAPAAAG